jgi:hypothetical protein
MITFSAYSATSPLFSSNKTSFREKQGNVITLLEQVLPPGTF